MRPPPFVPHPVCLSWKRIFHPFSIRRRKSFSRVSLAVSALVLAFAPPLTMANWGTFDSPQNLADAD
jgi:hypothetical protein